MRCFAANETHDSKSKTIIVSKKYGISAIYKIQTDNNSLLLLNKVFVLTYYGQKNKNKRRLLDKCKYVETKDRNLNSNTTGLNQQ